MAEGDEVSGVDRVFAALAYMGPLVLLGLVKRPRGRFLQYHTRQGLYLFGAAMALLAVTLGLLAFFQRVVKVDPVFLLLAVLLLLELLLYAVVVLVLKVLAARARMPMMPFFGDLAGER